MMLYNAQALLYVEAVRGQVVRRDMPVGEQLEALKKRAGLSVREMARRMGYKHGSGYQYWTEGGGKTKDHLEPERVEKLLSLVGVGDPPITRAEVLALFPPIRSDSSPIEPANITLPVLGEAQAGAWKEVATIEEMDPEQIPVPAEHVIKGARQYWIRVVGDSVDKFMPPGSLALCTDVWSWARDAEDFMSRADGRLVLCRRERHGLFETTIKQVRITGTKRELWPASNNPKHSGPIPLGDDFDGSQVQIQAVVTHALIQF